MLELQGVCFTIEKNGESVALVDEVTLSVPRGHFMAIVGPSGCGKTTLLKTIAGLNAETAGVLRWNGEELGAGHDFDPTELGYVPQFSIAFDPLTVDESVETATRLRVRTHGAAELDQRIDRALDETGLTSIADRPVRVLSGGQKRRLGLAMELVSDPKMLLCDEVTSGLDARSEREIVTLLHELSRRDGRIVLSVTHSLSHLELYDSILVLHEGRVAYHGPPELMTHYFSVADTEEVYPRLASQPAERWKQSWEKHRLAYAEKIAKRRQALLTSGALTLPGEHCSEDATVDSSSAPTQTPSALSQFSTLLSRRWRIFFRDRAQVLLQLAILLCFPLLVSLFSDKANVPIRSLSEMRQSDMMLEITEQQNVRSDTLKAGSALSGMIMFQVVLLGLMGSNNAAREVAGERAIFEKEKLGGLRPGAYLASKVAFLACLVVAQSLWMAIFVNFFSPFDGNFGQHALFLLLANGAMTAVCLGISALMKTAEQASLLSIYLVGFQLPLSGAVLALPEKVDAVTRPLISAYWAWSGSVQALAGSKHAAVRGVISTSLSTSELCVYWLLLHVFLGLALAWLGARRSQWQM